MVFLMDNIEVDVSTKVTHHPLDIHLVLVQVSAYSTSWATHKASHATMGSSERCNTLTLRQRYRVMLYERNANIQHPVRASVVLSNVVRAVVWQNYAARQNV